MYIQYKRTHEFFASHFNEENYERFDDAMDKFDVLTERKVELIHSMETREFTPFNIINMLRDIHGHNFKAEVEMMAHVDNRYSSYILSDEDIVNAIDRWAGINLSVHEDFFLSGIRATTENMAQVLCQKLFNKALAAHPNSDLVVNVTIHETDNISSTAVRSDNDKYARSGAFS
jgi:6-pyruvoyl-tetrahydropterin synthase